MSSGYVLNLSNNQFNALIAGCSNIDVYSNPKYKPETSKAKKLRKLWNTESDSVVGRVIIELLEIREDMIKRRSESDFDFTDEFAADAVRIKEIASAFYTKVYVSNSRQAEIEQIAEEIQKTGVKKMDSLHVACAIISSAEYFLSTDKRLLKYQTEKIKIVNPIEFIAELEEKL